MANTLEAQLQRVLDKGAPDDDFAILTQRQVKKLVTKYHIWK